MAATGAITANTPQQLLRAAFGKVVSAQAKIERASQPMTIFTSGLVPGRSAVHELLLSAARDAREGARLFHESGTDVARRLSDVALDAERAALSPGMRLFNRDRFSTMEWAASLRGREGAPSNVGWARYLREDVEELRATLAPIASVTDDQLRPVTDAQDATRLLDYVLDAGGNQPARERAAVALASWEALPNSTRNAVRPYFDEASLVSLIKGDRDPHAAASATDCLKSLVSRNREEFDIKSRTLQTITSREQADQRLVQILSSPTDSLTRGQQLELRSLITDLPENVRPRTFRTQGEHGATGESLSQALHRFALKDAPLGSSYALQDLVTTRMAITTPDQQHALARLRTLVDQPLEAWTLDHLREARALVIDLPTELRVPVPPGVDVDRLGGALFTGNLHSFRVDEGPRSIADLRRIVEAAS